MRVPVILLFIFLLTACGGGNISNNESSNNELAIDLVPDAFAPNYPIDSKLNDDTKLKIENLIQQQNQQLKNTSLTLRTPNIGDHFNYTININDGTTLSTGTTSVSYTQYVANGKGIDCIEAEVDYAFNLPGGGYDEYTTKALEYTDNAGVYECGDFDDASQQYDLIDNATGLNIITNNPANAGDILSGVTTYASGYWEDCTYNYEGLQNLFVVSLGAFEVLKASVTCSDADNNTTSGTIWIERITAALLRSEISVTNAANETTTIKLQLMNYSLQ